MIGNTVSPKDWGKERCTNISTLTQSFQCRRNNKRESWPWIKCREGGIQLYLRKGYAKPKNVT